MEQCKALSIWTSETGMTERYRVGIFEVSAVSGNDAKSSTLEPEEVLRIYPEVVRRSKS